VFFEVRPAGGLFVVMECVGESNQDVQDLKMALKMSPVGHRRLFVLAVARVARLDIYLMLGATLIWMLSYVLLAIFPLRNLKNGSLQCGNGCTRKDLQVSWVTSSRALQALPRNCALHKGHEGQCCAEKVG